MKEGNQSPLPKKERSIKKVKKNNLQVGNKLKSEAHENEAAC